MTLPTLKIGPVGVDPPVVLAPMAGVTNAAFRSLCRRFGAGLYVSEMVSARALVEGNANTARMVEFGADEDVRSVQLYGVDPHVVGEAVRRLVADVGVDHVDLNFGCPVPKVTRLGGGCALPVHRRLFADLVTAAVRAAGPVPVTVKMRKGVDDGTLTYREAGRVAADAGVAAVALHARTAEQLYSGAADWSAIAALKELVADVPVLGNGDVWLARDALRMVTETGCDGVVVGRGCLGRPWLFRDLADAFAGRPVRGAPLLGDVVTTMREHVQMLVEVKGDEVVGVRDFRKHVGWYLTGYPVGGAARRALTSAATLADVEALLDRLDPAVALPETAEGMPRGSTHGPRRVSLPEGWRESWADPAPPPPDADVHTSGG